MNWGISFNLFIAQNLVLTSFLFRSVVSPFGSGSSNIRTTQFAAIVSKMKYSNFLDEELRKTAPQKPIFAYFHQNKRALKTKCVYTNFTMPLHYLWKTGKRTRKYPENIIWRIPEIHHLMDGVIIFFINLGLYQSLTARGEILKYRVNIF